MSPVTDHRSAITILNCAARRHERLVMARETMMVVELLKKPHVLYQKPDGEFDLPEAAITACVDTGGVVVLGQEGREIVINRASAKELAKLIIKLSVAP